MRFFLYFCLLPCLLFSQEFRVQLDVSSDRVRLDEDLIVELKLNYPKGYKINPESLAANLLERGNFSEPPFKLINYDIVDKSDTSQSLRFVLEPQLVGYHPITFFDIPFTNGKKNELISPVRFVHILSTEIDSSVEIPLAPLMTFDKHYPFHPAMGETRGILFPPKAKLIQEAKALKAYKEVPWLAVAVLLVMGILLYLFRNYREVLTPQQRAAQAKKQAIAKIDTMRTMRLPATADYDSYYAAVTDIIRDYLSARYGVEAPKLTTNEFLLSLKEHRLFDSSLQAEIKELFQRADEVKFAGYNPSNDECVEAESTAKKLVSG